MTFLKQFFNFYINANIHVALAVYSLVRITEIYFHLPYNEPLDYFIFYGTIVGYNFVKYTRIAKLHHRSLTKNLKIIQLFSFVSFLLMTFYGSKLSLKTLMFFIPFGVLTVLYAVPFLKGFQKNLRTIGYLKIIIVAFVWSGTTVLIPLIDIQKEIDINVLLQTLQRFLLVVVLILPFDIRDMEYDIGSLQTIPQKLGIEKTKKIGFFLLALVLTIEFIIFKETYLKNVFLGFCTIVFLFLMKAKNNQSNYYSSFWVELLPIFWWVNIAVITNF